MDSNRKYPSMHSDGTGDREGHWGLAMNLSTGSVISMVLKAAVELDLFQIISRRGPGAQLSPSEIAAQIPTQNPATAAALLQRIMRLLTSYSVLTCSTRAGVEGAVETVYGLAPAGRFFVDGEDGASLASMTLVMQDRVTNAVWHPLKDAVIDGCLPFNKAHGRSCYKYMSEDQRYGALFDKAMKDHATLILTEMLQVYKGFESIKSLVDVGGRTGAALGRIITKYPHIKGINFDLPDVVAGAPDYPGVTHVGGDMFVSIPSADSILIMWVLLDWTDDRCLDILKNCYKALPDHGIVIIVDTILPKKVDTDAAIQSIFHLDLSMACLIGGKLRTSGELEALATGAGFAGCRLVCTVHTLSVIECRKKI